MKARHALTVRLAILASAAVGGFAVEQLRAQAKPPVYFIDEIDVTNPDGYANEYLPKAREIIKAHGGRLVASGGAAAGRAQVIAVDGEASKRILIYVYPSIDAVRAWRNDPEYEQIRKNGEKYAKYRTFAVEGLTAIARTRSKAGSTLSLASLMATWAGRPVPAGSILALRWWSALDGL